MIRSFPNSKHNIKLPNQTLLLNDESLHLKVKYLINHWSDINSKLNLKLPKKCYELTLGHTLIAV